MAGELTRDIGAARDALAQYLYDLTTPKVDNRQFANGLAGRDAPVQNGLFDPPPAFDTNSLARFRSSEHDRTPAPPVERKYAEARSYDPTWRDNMREYAAKALGINLDQRLDPATENLLTGITGRGTTPGVAEIVMPPIGAGGQAADAVRAARYGNAQGAAMHGALAAVPYVPWSKAMGGLRNADLRQSYPNAAAAFDMESATMGRDGLGMFKPFGDRTGTQVAMRHKFDPLGERVPNAFERDLPNAERVMRDQMDTNPIFDGAYFRPGEQTPKMRGREAYVGSVDAMPSWATRADNVDYTVMAPMQSHTGDYRVRYGNPIEHAPELPRAQMHVMDRQMDYLKADLENVMGRSQDWLRKTVADFDKRYAADAALKRNQPVGARTIAGPWRSPRDQSEIAESIPDLPAYRDPLLDYLKIGAPAATSAASFDGKDPNVMPWWWPR